MTIQEGKGVWLDFDVTQLVSYWFKYPWRNIGLSITALDEHGQRVHLDDNSSQVSILNLK